VGFRICLDAVVQTKIPFQYRESKPGCPAHSQVTILTELPQTSANSINFLISSSGLAIYVTLALCCGEDSGNIYLSFRSVIWMTYRNPENIFYILIQ